jgi:hypothetical protein
MRNATVPIKLDQWESLRLQCQDDARGYIADCVAQSVEQGNYTPPESVLAGFDAMAVMLASLMAEHARLSAEVGALRRRGWLRRVLGF